MRKYGFVLGIMAALVLAALVTGNAFAQGGTPANPQAPGQGFGQGGMMGGRGVAGTGGGILHDGMIAVYAQELGIAVEDLNARLAGGETMAQIAAAEGLSTEEFSALMISARSQAIDQAVTDGTLTQQQADWMKQRTGGLQGRGVQGGLQNGGRGMRGGNAGCPYLSQTN